MLMGFILQFYIIFGTNLLTQGPVQIVVFFAYFGVSQKRNIKQNENFRRVIFGTNVTQRTWSGRQEINKEATRQGGAPAPLGAPPTLVGPSWLHRPTSSSYIYLHTHKPSEQEPKPYFHRRNLLYPRDPILGPFPEPRRRGHRSQRATTSTARPLR